MMMSFLKKFSKIIELYRIKKSNIPTKFEMAIDTSNYFKKILQNQNSKITEKLRGKVDIIIPIYNAYEYVVRCVDSVLKNSNNCRIIIIDDASTDKKIDLFLDKLSMEKNKDIEIIILRNQKNLGLVKTLNRAYEEVKNHFVSLNSDTEVSHGWLDRLFSPIFENENIVASVTPFSNDGLITSFPNSMEKNPLFKGLDHTTIDKYFEKFGLQDFLEIPIGVGFCFAINKKISDKIGLFDEIFGKGYAEESDWCMRATKKGYKHVVAPNLFVLHHHGISFENKEKMMLLKKNKEILLKRFPDYDKIIQGFVFKDRLGPLKDIYCMLIDIFTSSGKKLVMVIDPEMGTKSVNLSNEIKKELKNYSNIMHIGYNHHEEILSLNYHGFITRTLHLHNTNPDDVLSKLISFFTFDQILVYQANRREPNLKEIQKDNLKNFFRNKIQ